MWAFVRRTGWSALVRGLIRQGQAPLEVRRLTYALETMNLRSEVSRALVDRGFTRVGRTHLRREDDQFSYWVDTGPIGTRSDIVPFLGLRHDRVSEISDRLRGLEPDPYSGTVGGNVGKVLGGPFRRWSANGDTREVVSTILTGLEALRPYMTLERLPAAFDASWAVGPSNSYRLVVVYLLLENRAQVEESLDRAEAEYCRQDDEICATFRRFEAGVRVFLDRPEQLPR